MPPLLLVERHRMPVIVDRLRLVFDRQPGMLQAIAEFEILVTVAGELLVEPPDALEVGARAPTRCRS